MCWDMYQAELPPLPPPKPTQFTVSAGSTAVFLDDLGPSLSSGAVVADPGPATVPPPSGLSSV